LNPKGLLRRKNIERSSFTHVILTRYALSFDGKPLNDEWLKSRRKLFERITIPSINAQTNTNFIWIVLMDESILETESEYLRPLIFTKATVNFVAGSSPFVHDPSFWQEVLPANAKERKLLTTRLDSDDWIDSSFVMRVQKAAQTCKKNSVILFPIGLNIDVLTWRFKVMLFPNNQFASYLENPTQYPFQTVHKVDHVQLSKQERVKWCFPPVFPWAMVVHERNILNVSRGIMIPKFGTKFFTSLQKIMK
jgi:hypothetical protein